MNTAPRRVVYVSYDGMEEPLGRSQVLPYIRGLAARGHRFDLVSFEKGPAPLRFREPLEEGIRWTTLRYHKRPALPATAFDMAQGLSLTSLLALLSGVDLIHVRSYVPAAAVLPLVMASSIPLLFDMRGLWADEKREDGSWASRPRLYRATKRVERLLLERASAVTVLTHSMQRYLRQEHPQATRFRAPIRVIPTCTDLARFRPDLPPTADLKRELADAAVLTYVGSIGGRYLPEEMARFYLAFRKVQGPSRFLVLSRQDPAPMRAILQAAGAAAELVHRSVAHEEVPAYVRAADAGIFFYRDTFGTRGCAPTKLGELLASGIPVVGNDIGDVADVLKGGEVGVVVRDFEPTSLERAAARLFELIEKKRTAALARSIAERYFSLPEAVEAYDEIYRGLSAGGPVLRDEGWPRSPAPVQGETQFVRQSAALS